MTNPYYLSVHWRRLRSQRMALDQGICQGCHRRPATTVDHIRTRPAVPYPTAADCLANLRSLCGVCDRLVKELPGGRRRNDGVIRIRGCDRDGLPHDPRYRR